MSAHQFRAGEFSGEQHAVIQGACGKAGLGAEGDGSIVSLAAAMKVDAGESGLHELQRVIATPESGREGVAYARLAAVITGVGFRHAVGTSAHAAGLLDERDVALELRIR